MGVPGYSDTNDYNYVALSFWLVSGPADVALVWSNPSRFMGDAFGTTDKAIQTFLKKKFTDAGVKLLVSAFGATNFPTSEGADPTQTAVDLAKFVKDNLFDGVDIDYEDNAAMNAGTGVPWLITFQRKLAELLPGYIITHAPQGPYFKGSHYQHKGYVGVDQQVGNTIDFYTVQFYNQGDTKYDSYTELFTRATGYFSGTSVKEIIAQGVPSEKIVVGKAAAAQDIMNTGLVSITELGQWGAQAYREFGWSAGYMFWQFRSDLKGDKIRAAMNPLVEAMGNSPSPSPSPQPEPEP